MQGQPAQVLGYSIWCNQSHWVMDGVDTSFDTSLARLAAHQATASSAACKDDHLVVVYFVDPRTRSLSPETRRVAQ